MAARNTGALVLVVALLAIIGLEVWSRSPHSVSTPAAAVAVAKASWASVYAKTPHDVFGPTNVARFEPYTAELRDGTWFVSGTMSPGASATDMRHARIRKSDGAASVSAGHLDGF